MMSWVMPFVSNLDQTESPSLRLLREHQVTIYSFDRKKVVLHFGSPQTTIIAVPSALGSSNFEGAPPRRRISSQFPPSALDQLSFMRPVSAQPSSRGAVLSRCSGTSTTAFQAGTTGKNRPFVLRDLDYRDTSILKGLAVFAIVFHNFFHAVGPVHQNEFTFDSSRFDQFLRTIVHPALAVQAVFSFFGHFGVQLFIFLSAYGLAKSHWDDKESWAEFMWGRIRKLYPKFGLIIVPWVLASCVLLGPLVFCRQSGLETLLMVLGLSTILGFCLPPIAPWWFIPFILQFYAVWPILRKIAVRFGWQGLLVFAILCRIVTFVTFPILARWQLDLLLTPIGHMSELCFGIVAARHEIHISAPFAFLGCAVLWLGSLYIEFWLFTYVAALLISLWVYSCIRARVRDNHFLQKLGEYSLLIFLVNAIVRDQFLSYATSPLAQIFWACVSAVVSFLIAALIQDWLLPRPTPACSYRPSTGRVAVPVLLAEPTSLN
jgi:peptidoglycan/LPS O-acetylase OafA/YrhL